jgi:hypothetical protein
MIRRGACVRVARVAALAVGLAAGDANAQPNDAGSQANELFAQGRQAMRQRDYANACAIFKEAMVLDERVGTALNLSYCEEYLGHLVAARAYAEQAQRLARAQHDDREHDADLRFGELDPKVPRLTVTLSTAPGCAPAVVTRDGATLDAARIGAPQLVDPGEQHVAATAPGCEDAHVDLRLGAGERRTVDLPIAPRAPASDAAPRSRIPVFVSLGAGAVGFGVGTAFGLSAISKKSDSEAFCNGTVCQQRGLDLRQDAKRAATVSTVAFVAGAAFLVAAATFWLTSAPGTGAAVRAHPHVGLAPAGVEGAW